MYNALKPANKSNSLVCCHIVGEHLYRCILVNVLAIRTIMRKDSNIIFINVADKIKICIT